MQFFCKDNELLLSNGETIAYTVHSCMLMCGTTTEDCITDVKPVTISTNTAHCASVCLQYGDCDKKKRRI